MTTYATVIRLKLLLDPYNSEQNNSHYENVPLLIYFEDDKDRLDNFASTNIDYCKSCSLR